MSSFGGLMEEYNSISIDRFDGINLNSTVFMLSHNHKDHTVGLSSGDFQYRLKNNSALKLYCSPITHDLLLLEDCYAPIWASIVPLKIDSPCIIDIPDANTGKVKRTVTVTLLQAGHCPGSVMFLFEGDEGTVLYTGDFRLTKEDIASYFHLHSANGSVKELRSVYADTTFCVPKAFFIPKREDCISATIGIVHDWISRSPGHIVLLSCKANLGYENMFIRLSEEFQSKIHVHQFKYKQYQHIENLANSVTSDPAETQIHACRWHSGRYAGSLLPCGYRGDGSMPIMVRTIVLSTMCFVQTVGLDAYSKRFSENFFRVCYSFHSSYSEIRDMILYLKPDRAFPNVIPIYDDPSIAQVQRRLNGFVKLAKKAHFSALHLGSGEFGLLKSPKGKKRKCSSQQSHNSGSLLLFDEEENKCITPKKKKCAADFLLSSKPDSIASNSDFPLLFGSQESSGNSSTALRSPSSDPGVVGSQKEEVAGKSFLSDVESTAVTDEELESSEVSDSGIKDLPECSLGPGPLMSYMSEDDADQPGPLQTPEVIAPELKSDPKDSETAAVACERLSTETEDSKPLLNSKLEVVASSPSIKAVSSRLETCLDISQETDFSDVIIVDENSENEKSNRANSQSNEVSSELNSSRTIDSDATVNIGSYPYKKHNASPEGVCTITATKECEYIDLTSDDSTLQSATGVTEDAMSPDGLTSSKTAAGESKPCPSSSDVDSLSDDYEGDDEFEETDKESGYDSDAEIISSRKCAFECVIKERALRFSRTAVNSSDVIVIDDDEANETGTKFSKGRCRTARYSSTESTGSTTSTESLLSDSSQDEFLDNDLSNVLLHDTSKPRLWLPQPQGSFSAIKLASSEDLYSS